MKRLRIFLLFIVIFPCLISSGLAATYYIDPVNGSMENDGSKSYPWATLQQLVEEGYIESKQWTAPYSSSSILEVKNAGAPVQAGDTLVLMSGYHGKVDIHRYINDDYITIRAGEGQVPTLSHLNFRSASRWVVSGLHISPFYGETTETTLLRIDSHSWTGPSSDIHLSDNSVFSVADSGDWTKDDWLQKVKSGISVSGDDCTVKNNSLRNVNFGITVSGDRAVVSGNRVINFAGDGMRGLGDYGLFEYNLVANAIKINENHDDGFQSWAVSGEPVVGMVLRGNRFYTNLNHPNEALLSTFQGIGCFDGYYQDWRIVNNLVVVSHYHGISVYGATNTEIVNNTVVDDPLHKDDRMIPWIRLNEHKDGSYGEGNIVRNNIGKLASTSYGVTIDHNYDPGVKRGDDTTLGDHSNYDLYFKARLSGNYQLIASAPAVGGGVKESAPPYDIRGRLRGARIDAGAYGRGVSLPFLPLLFD